MSKANPFDFVNALNAGKDVENMNGYVPFIINRQFSYFADTILLASELNRRASLDHDQQFAFYINTIRPRKRFSKWSKTEKNDDLKLIADYFGYSLEKAKQALSVLSDDKINEIRKKFNKGGLKK